MATSSSLFVPVDLQAFCVGNQDVNGESNNPPYGTIDFAQVAADFSSLPYLDENGGSSNGDQPAISEMVTPQYFDQTKDPLQTGVHLHWALPDALAHGTANEEGSIEFREVPNRWLVIRIISNANDKPDLAAWIVASDQLWNKEKEEADIYNQLSRAIPLKLPDSLPNKAFATMGKVYPYTEWTEPSKESAISKHTAVGYGEATYAAAYVHSKNVFGFYDPLTGYTDSESEETSHDMAYMLLGWYSDEKNDPINKLDFSENTSYEEKLRLLQKTYQWSFIADDTNPFPSHTFCHSLLFNLSWEPEKTYVKKATSNNLQLAIGNNTVQALSALMANQPESKKLDHLEEVLNILQFGLLPHFEEPGGLGAAEEKLHLTTFSPTAAASIWLVKPKNSKKNGVRKGTSSTDQVLPDEIADKLNQLNVQQMGYNSIQQELESLQAQLYNDWYKYMLLAYPIDQPNTNEIPVSDEIDINHAYDFLIEESEKIAGSDFDGTGGIINTLIQLESTIERLKSDLETDIAKLNMELVPVQAPRYWQGADPVVLISGKEVQAHQRHGKDGRFDNNGYLNCRLSSQLLSSVDVHTGDEVTNSITQKELPTLEGPVFPFIFENQVEALLTEVLLMTPGQAGFLAQLAGAVDLKVVIQEVQNNLLEDQENDQEVITFSGLFPSPIGYTDWGGEDGENPWIPLLMQWEVYFDPILPIKLNEKDTASAYPANFITYNFEADNSNMPVELTTKNPPPEQMSNLQYYRGASLLTSGAEINLKSQIQAFVKNYPDDAHKAELKKILSYLKTNTLPRQSLVLSGFNEALVMCKQTLQLPVFDPFAILEGNTNQFINTDLPQLIGQQNKHSPLPNNYFNPIRAGYMKIAKVRIIDAFGQTQDIETPDTIVAQSLRDTASPDPTLIALPPRITQPSRLLFRWIAAADNSIETNSHPITTPIFGWVLFNHLEASLAIYDAEGAALGSFNLRGPLWQGAPGHRDTFGKPDPSDALDQLPDTPVNQHLKNFVSGIFNKMSQDDSTNYLAAILDAIDLTVTNIDPATAKQYKGLSVLFGRPLALTRASLKLQLKGLPAIDQSWTAFKHRISNATGDHSAQDMAGFAEVQFPVQLGDLSNVNDGLVGYFVTDKKDDDDNAYAAFYAPAIRTSSLYGYGVEEPSFDHLKLRPSFGLKTKTERGLLMVDQQDDADTIYLSMLIDPRAKIHATTGILPTKAIEIPSHLFNESLQHIAATFLTAPILRSKAKLAIPLPEEPGFKWSWITKGKGEWNVNQNIAKINQKGAFSYPPTVIEEGWVQLQKQAPPSPAKSLSRSPVHAYQMIDGFLADGLTGLSSQQHALVFSLENSNNDPVIYITDDPDRNQLTLRVFNLSDRIIQFTGGEPFSSIPQDSDTPSFFLLSFKGVLSTEEFRDINIVADGWQSQYIDHEEEGASFWALMPTNNINLQAQDNISFKISNIKAGSRTHNGNLSINYYKLNNLPDSSDRIRVFLEQAPDPDLKNLRLNAAFVQNNIFTTSDLATPVSNRLELHLSNPDPLHPIVGADTPWNGTPPLFNITFQYGTSPGYGALTSEEHARNIEFSVDKNNSDNWWILPKVQHDDDPFWLVFPEKNEVLGIGNDATLVLHISNIITPNEDGPTLMYIQSANFPGYNDGIITLSMQKQKKQKPTSLPVSLMRSAFHGESIIDNLITNNISGLSTQQNALALSLENANNDPLVYITDDPNHNVLRLRLINISDHTLHLKGGVPISRLGQSIDGPSAIYLNMHGVLTKEEFKNIKIHASNWQSTYFENAWSYYWALTPVQPISIKAKEEISFNISELRASHRMHHGILKIYFFNLPGLANHSDTIPVFLQHAPNPMLKDLELQAAFLSGNNVRVSSIDEEEVSNKLELYISNSDTTSPIVAADTLWESSRPIFKISFPYGASPGYGALSSVQAAVNIKIDVEDNYKENWTIVPKLQSKSPFWLLIPEKHEVLGVGQDAGVVFDINNIVTYLQPGPTLMYLEYANIPGYNDGFQALWIQKRSRLQIESLRVQPSWQVYTQQPKRVVVSWVVKNASSVRLHSDIGEQLVSGKSSWLSPRSISNSTRFRLLANGQNEVEEQAETVFEVVDYKVSADLLPESKSDRFHKVIHSPILNRAYFFNPKGKMLILDTSNNQPLGSTTISIASITSVVISNRADWDTDRIYIADEKGHVIQVYDISKEGEMTLVKEIRLPSSGGSAIAIAPDSQRIYFSTGSKGIGYIESADFQIRYLDALIAKHQDIREILISADGRYLYCSCGGKLVQGYDLIRNQSIGEISVGKGYSWNMGITPDGNQLYITNQIDGTVTVIFVKEKMSTEVISVGGTPSDLLVSPDGKCVYILHSLEESITLIDTSIQKISYSLAINNPGNQQGSISGMTISPDGNQLYLTDTGLNFGIKLVSREVLNNYDSN